MRLGPRLVVGPVFYTGKLHCQATSLGATVAVSATSKGCSKWKIVNMISAECPVGALVCPTTGQSSPLVAQSSRYSKVWLRQKRVPPPPLFGLAHLNSADQDPPPPIFDWLISTPNGMVSRFAETPPSQGRLHRHVMPNVIGPMVFVAV